jgi:tetratricopeptide (TPR) repeat protein
VWTNIGKKTKFTDLVSPAQKSELARWEAEGIRGLHHHCTGSIFLARARMERNPRQKRSDLDRAMGESLFSYKRSNVQSPKFAYIATQIASIYYEEGKYDRALQVLLDALADNPNNDILYSATAVMQRKLGHTKEAKDTLLLGFEAMDGKSAEICYNLGLLSLELGEIDDAEKYAKLAYEQGFPLPGLRNKLQELGRM